MTIVAGVGHRPSRLYKAYQGEKYIIETIEAVLPSLGNIELGISGMALGFDMAIAKVFVNHNIPWIAAIPFKGFDARWHPESRQNLNHLLGFAQEIVYTNNLTKSPQGPFRYTAMIHKRNEYIVSRADTILTLWNGNYTGTSSCVFYAAYKQKRIINIWDKYLEVTGWDPQS